MAQTRVNENLSWKRRINSQEVLKDNNQYMGWVFAAALVRKGWDYSGGKKPFTIH